MSILRIKLLNLYSRNARRSISIIQPKALSTSLTKHSNLNLSKPQYYTPSALNFSVQSRQARHLSTSNILSQKDDKNDKKNKDKEAEKKKKEQEQKMEALKEELEADWNSLSGFGKTMAVLFASIFASGIIKLFGEMTKDMNVDANKYKQASVNDLMDLLYDNKAKHLKYNNFSKSLFYENLNDGRIYVIKGVNQIEISNQIEKFYDSIKLHFKDRQHVSIDVNENEEGSKVVKMAGNWFGYFFPDHIITMGLIFYFSIFMKIKARRGGQSNPFGSMFSNMQNQAKNNQPGKKGGKNKKNNQGGPGGIFGAMQGPDSDMGTLIEASEIDVGFGEVAGCEEAKIEVIEIVDFLRNKAKYEKAGAEVPKGAVFHGPPGTGKTLLAKACAKEAGVNFIQCSGSDFIEMYVGLGSKRVRTLFEKARDNAPSILFIDEIDSVGGKRGGGMGGGGGMSEQNQTINSILAEMDGFNTGKIPVVVMAATNRLESLDDALLRPGRFDRKIYVGSPDVEGRSKIFNIHLRKLNTEDKKEELAKYLSVKTPGMAGAEIKNICNEAALHSVRNGDSKVTKHNFEKAVDRVIAGMEKQNSLLDPAVKRRIAVHEAGHAVTSWFLKHCMPLVKVTITPRTGGALGFALYQPDSNNVLQEKQYFLDQMTSTLAGRAAEDVFYEGTVSSGAHDDLKKVTSSAYQMIMRLGMGDTIRNLNYHDMAESMGQGAHQIVPSQKTRETLDIEIQQLVDEQYKRAVELGGLGWGKFSFLVESRNSLFSKKKFYPPLLQSSKRKTSSKKWQTA